MTEYHLVVLVHGLWGNRSHFDYIVQALEEYADRHWYNEKNQLLVYTTTLNEGFRTYDGIDVCGFRVAQEIANKIDSLGGISRITKFSLVGYSLGGLIARYALGLLYKKGFFEKRNIELINFTTFCTPHVGVLAPGKNVAVNIFNGVVPWLLGNSGKQIFLKDSVHNHGLKAEDEPLIYLMSHEDSVFFKGLQSFKNKSLYANVINDKRTAWWTAGISLNDPFFDIDEFNGTQVFRYIPGYETVVVDRDQPIIISKIQSSKVLNDAVKKNCDVDSSNVDEQLYDFFFLNYWFAKLCRWVVVICNLCIIAPLILIWKIAQSGMMMTISAVRVARFLDNYSTQLLQDFFAISAPRPLSIEGNMIENQRNDLDDADNLDVDDVSYRDNELIDIGPRPSNSSSLRSVQSQNTKNYNMFGESLNEQADHLMESIYDAIERKDTHAGFLQESFSGPDAKKAEDNSLVVSIRELECKTTEQLNTKHGPDMGELIDNLHLDISPKQVNIIKSLNKINWNKYPIYIRKTPSTHACAIMRQQDVFFDEGKIVVKHWIEKNFQIS